MMKIILLDSMLKQDWDQVYVSNNFKLSVFSFYSFGSIKLKKDILYKVTAYY